jgi:methylisocitrate lyase
LASGTLVRMPGAFLPISALLIERKGFEGVYVSGAALSAGMGLPDVGLTTVSEVAQRAAEIARVTELPTLVDADTGFGGPMNVARTVQLMEDAGVAGIHLEDQVNPKRCGHLDGKEVVDTATAVQRIRAAVESRRDAAFLIVARTDIRALAGPETLMERANALVDAGADAIFPEALPTLAEFAALRAALEVPILANVTEFGKSDLFSHRQLADVGVNMVIHPVSLLRLAMGAVARGLDTLMADQTLTGQLPQMQTRADLYDLLDYAGYDAFDGGVYTFDLRNNHSGNSTVASA